ncbi:glycosyltransferase [Caldisericum exile]|uniref:glycosyltransferase n=1 Tax=Caldisericum exile TaxID=693075 RepID=UPI003C77C8E7
MYLNTTFLTIILLFVGTYYLFLFIVALYTGEIKKGKNENFFYFLIIPAKNEEKVIARTIEACLRLKGDNFRLVVVDDASNDRTPFIVKSFAKNDPRVILLNRDPNEPKRGKGAVLNYAFQQIKLAIDYNFLEPFNLDKEFFSQFDKDHVIIGVFDADAKPSEDMLFEISQIFSNLNVSAVQTAVRISNRDQSLLSKMQDIEFLGFSRIIQKARSRFGSVGLGGNGQFSKFSSLESIGEMPWGQTLTEDFELGLRMISNGMRLYYTDNAIVEQEGVITLKALFKQRTRWLQGHFTNWKYIPSVLRSKSSLITKIDTFIYIVFVSVVFLVGLSLTLSFLSILKLIMVKNSMLEPFYNKHYLLGLLALLFYSFAFIPMFVYSVFEYYNENGFFEKISYILLFALYTYIWLPAGVFGLYRIATGKTEWVKTSRVTSYIPSFANVDNDTSQYFVERRRFPRFTFHSFTFASPKVLCFLDNLSQGGAKVIFPKDVELIQDVLEISVPLYGKKRTRIVWQKMNDNFIEAGVEFVS